MLCEQDEQIDSRFRHKELIHCGQCRRYRQSRAILVYTGSCFGYRKLVSVAVADLVRFDEAVLEEQPLDVQDGAEEYAGRLLFVCGSNGAYQCEKMSPRVFRWSRSLKSVYSSGQNESDDSRSLFAGHCKRRMHSQAA